MTDRAERRLEQRPSFWLVCAGFSVVIGLGYLGFAWFRTEEAKPWALAYLLFGLGHAALGAYMFGKFRHMRRSAAKHTA